LRAVVVKALELTLPMYERRTRALELDLTDAPCIVAGDEVRLAQVVSNLLINAAKFTPDPGAVKLSLRAANGHATIEVADKGMESTPSCCRTCSTCSCRRRSRSTGALAASGWASRSSRCWCACTAAASRPRARAPVAAAASPCACRSPRRRRSRRRRRGRRRCPARSGRVLVVDDNRDAADTLALVLEAFGYEVRTAYDSVAALEALRDFAPDAAILDIGLRAWTATRWPASSPRRRATRARAWSRSPATARSRTATARSARASTSTW
jgi:CheY-like chemotaxis protein